MYLNYQAIPLSRAHRQPAVRPEEQIAQLKKKLEEQLKTIDTLTMRNLYLQRRDDETQKREQKMWDSYNQEVKRMTAENNRLQEKLRKEQEAVEHLKRKVEKLTRPGAERQQRLDLDEIERVVCEFFKKPIEKVRSKSRKGDLVKPRFFVMYFQATLTKASLESIGDRMGGRDHTTVINARDTLRDRVENEPDLKAAFDYLFAKLTQK